MTSTTIEPRVWPLRKFFTGISVVLVLQAVVFLWPTAQPPAPAPGRPAPTIHLATGHPGGLLALADPTLFALPHREGFSGAGWIKTPRQEFQLREWSDSEPPRWLPLSVQELGAGFKNFVQSNAPPAFQVVSVPDLMPVFTGVFPDERASTQSTVRVEGSLAQRRLLSLGELKSWFSPTVLTNTVVRVLVNARGTVESRALLSRSGSDDADRDALELAREARFESIEITGPDRTRNADHAVTLGTLIFEWQAAPAPATNQNGALP